MTMRCWICATLAGLLALTAAVVRADDQKTVTITDQDKDPKVMLAKGDKLLLKLSSNPTTGYSWEVASKENAALNLTGKPVYEAADKDKKVVGGGGTQTFTFDAVSAGEVDVEMQYKRPFEKDKEPAKVFKFKVTIK